MRDRNEIKRKADETKTEQRWRHKDLQALKDRMAAGVHSLREAQDLDERIRDAEAIIKALSYRIDALEWAAKIGIYEE